VKMRVTREPEGESRTTATATQDGGVLFGDCHLTWSASTACASGCPLPLPAGCHRCHGFLLSHTITSLSSIISNSSPSWQLQLGSFCQNSGVLDILHDRRRYLALGHDIKLRPHLVYTDRRRMLAKPVQPSTATSHPSKYSKKHLRRQ
jgi:hypothetical protein